MNRKVTKVLGLAMAAAMTVMTGCGSSAPAAVSDTTDNSADNAVGSEASVDQGETRKIGVLVADVSGEEALGFRNYYEKYIQNYYNVSFDYTDALASAEDEKAAIEKFASKGYDAVISLSSSDRVQQIETCEEYGIYYAVASGVLDESQYETYKTYEHFVGQVGPSNETEFEAGKEMGKYFKDKGVKSVAIYGAFIPNPMHVYRAAGVIAGLGDALFENDLAMTPLIRDPVMVLEVKYDRILPEYLKKAISSARLLNSSISKYCIARELLG